MFETPPEAVRARFAAPPEPRKRSSAFQGAVGAAVARGMSIDEIEAVARANPEGCASKYLNPVDRLREEIERSYAKAKGPGPEPTPKPASEPRGASEPEPAPEPPPDPPEEPPGPPPETPPEPEPGPQEGGGGPQFTPPVIRIIAGERARVVAQAEAALLASGEPIYARAGALVRPVLETVPAARGLTTTVVRFRELCRASTLGLLDQVAVFERFNASREAWVAVNPPGEIAEIMLTREGLWPFPTVAGAIATPTLRPDGSLLSTPGYDPATRLYLTPGLTLPPIDLAPSQDDARAALRRLLGLLSGFPFVSALDRSVALSGVSTAALRAAMEVAPLHGVRSPTPGVGKSHLIDVIAATATGRRCPVIRAAQTEEESEKRLGALLMAGVPLVSLDNVSTTLGGDTLCQMVERPVVRVRILGRSKAPEFECKAAVFATGNNLTLTGDMTRRALLCTLDAEVERPELREFGFDPLVRVLANRGPYVAAVLTTSLAYQAYRAAGGSPVCAPLGSYADWSERVRAPLIWLGEADPIASMETAREEDPDLVNLREIFAHWEAGLGLNTPYTVSAIIQAACRQDRSAAYDEGPTFANAEFRDVLMRVAGAGGAVLRPCAFLLSVITDARCLVTPVPGFGFQVDAAPLVAGAFDA